MRRIHKAVRRRRPPALKLAKKTDISHAAREMSPFPLASARREIRQGLHGVSVGRIEGVWTVPHAECYPLYDRWHSKRWYWLIRNVRSGYAIVVGYEELQEFLAEHADNPKFGDWSTG